MIPTSPSGSPWGGGEVGIAEAERSDRVSPGRRGAGPASRRTVHAWTDVALRCGSAAAVRLLRITRYENPMAPFSGFRPVRRRMKSLILRPAGDAPRCKP